MGTGKGELTAVGLWVNPVNEENRKNVFPRWKFLSAAKSQGNLAEKK